jgi:hypothetical protein
MLPYSALCKIILYTGDINLYLNLKMYRFTNNQAPLHLYKFNNIDVLNYQLLIMILMDIKNFNLFKQIVNVDFILANCIELTMYNAPKLIFYSILTFSPNVSSNWVLNAVQHLQITFQSHNMYNYIYNYGDICNDNILDTYTFIGNTISNSSLVEDLSHKSDKNYIAVLLHELYIYRYLIYDNNSNTDKLYANVIFIKNNFLLPFFYNSVSINI